MDCQPIYTSFEIRKSKIEEGVWIVEATHVRHDQMGKWEGSGTYCRLYLVTGYYVVIHPLSHKPTMVFKSLQEFMDMLVMAHPSTETFIID